MLCQKWDLEILQNSLCYNMYYVVAILESDAILFLFKEHNVNLALEKTQLQKVIKLKFIF